MYVRVRHLESPESYGRRLAAGNGLPEHIPATAASQLVLDEIYSSKTVALARWCEVKGGLRSDHFEKQRIKFQRQTLPNRYMCRLCAYGEEIVQIDHAGANCCIRHGLWTGPGALPGNQTSVPDQILTADSTYRRLSRQGWKNLALMRELSSLIEREKGNEPNPHVFVVDTYPTVIKLADELTRPEFLRELLNPTKTLQEARATLRRLLRSDLSVTEEAIETSIWLLLRPTFLLVREYLEGRESGHAGAISVTPSAVFGRKLVMRPLEPFSRFLQGISFTEGFDVRDRFELHMIPGQFEVPRRQVRQGIQATEFLCIQGHRYMRTPNAAEQTFRSGQVGCPYCSGLSVLAGFNSMAETNPQLATEWNHEKNEEANPSNVSGAGNSQSYWWRCSERHSWKASPNNRAKGKGCPYCSGRSPILGVNTMDITHPEVSSEWDYSVNTQLTPGQISAGSGIKVGWVCKSGHKYKATPANRTGRGTGCPACANLLVVPGFNDLATTHPELAVEWDVAANGIVRSSDIVAGSYTPRRWTCKLGHSYEATPSMRSHGRGCPVCAGKQVSASANSLAVFYPDIAARWHPTANGEITPWQVTAHSGRKVYWRCVLGHDFEKVIAKYTAGPRCPVCTGHQLLTGFNDLYTRYPEIASEWHPQKNGELTANDVVPGNGPRWWLCAKGHEQRGTVPNRITTAGCSKCPRSERVAWKQGSRLSRRILLPDLSTVEAVPSVIAAPTGSNDK